MPVIVTTSDGSHTLFVPELNEHYHSIHGAFQESSHIYIRSGLMFTDRDPLNILEIGFGTGLNALLTAVSACNGPRTINYTAIEKYPISSEIAGGLNHGRFAGEEGTRLFSLIHSVPWEEFVPVCQGFYLRKMKLDLITDEIPGEYNLIYFDAFGPGSQPAMWTGEIFRKIAALTEKDGILVTYSVKGEVKRNLRSAGFSVTRLPGPPGKRQMIRAIKS